MTNELNTTTEVAIETTTVETPVVATKKTRKAKGAKKAPKAAKTKTKAKVQKTVLSKLKVGPDGKFTTTTSAMVRLAAISIPKMITAIEAVGGKPIPEAIASIKEARAQRKALIAHAIKEMDWGWHKGNVVNAAKKAEYGAAQHCDDDVANQMAAFVRSSNDDGTDYLDMTKVRAVAKLNSISLDRWMHCNIGQIRMNLGNVLRGKVRRGVEVTIGDKIWNKGSTVVDKAPKAIKPKKAA